jgi:hypothetical protein
MIFSSIICAFYIAGFFYFCPANTYVHIWMFTQIVTKEKYENDYVIEILLE